MKYFLIKLLVDSRPQFDNKGFASINATSMDDALGRFSMHTENIVEIDEKKAKELEKHSNVYKHRT